MTPIRIGCSGWQYKDWRERFYPKGLAQRRWLQFYAGTFDTVEVNATFYRLARPDAVARWVEETPDDFVFSIKGSQYLTHMKRLLVRDTDPPALERFYASIAPLVESPKLGPVLWQLPPNFRRDDDRLAAWLEALPPGRHALEVRHDSWFVPEVYGLLYAHGVAFVIGDDPRRVDWPLEVTAPFTFVRFHYGTRGRRGNYSETELREWAARLRDLATGADVWAYFNNDWEAFAIANGKRLKRLLDLE